MNFLPLSIGAYILVQAARHAKQPWMSMRYSSGLLLSSNEQEYAESLAVG